MNSNKLIGERIKSARMQLGYSRREFAEKSNFSAATIQAWEDGKYSIPQKSLAKYVDALFKVGLITNTEWFITGEGLAPRPANKVSADDIDDAKLYLSKEESLLREISFFEKENENAIIMSVTDDSMLPFFEIGDYVAGKIVSGQKAHNFVNCLCIITVTSGETYIRKLRPGSKDEHFNLISTNIDTNVNPAFLVDCKIHKIAKVTWHRKAEIALS
ncbi:helix-turn-helix domain-containing protein [Legionella massiliensis]|nr:helix-turn-helix domain-containing protein [Legionella massiliensis]